MSTIVRRAREADLPQLGRMGAGLARQHHTYDAQRFFVVPDMDEDYAWWLGQELQNENAIVLAAELDGRIVGYAYGTLEERDWNALRDACGVLVDIVIAREARGRGVGRAMCEAMFAAFREHG